ncbi:MAG: hypothetical protein KGL35_29835 [Bradyrhizobium sp.]|uniref:hypothetical protein n=1 Tax=Bradyrhizobium sp. TaxID=376 RepID=UPI001C29F518|nr:hypothetical protein [Bradyrhizobium sp.]MBU6461369.1 hypothetical protein [Pseudomonadota bacterium]MDE2066545.1 hypothetical protein [Bradyrhizobium sp.]MDE2472807.1 hypothetical protein [Bradyrhizobium sp.]
MVNNAFIVATIQSSRPPALEDRIHQMAELGRGAGVDFCTSRCGSPNMLNALGKLGDDRRIIPLGKSPKLNELQIVGQRTEGKALPVAVHMRFMKMRSAFEAMCATRSNTDMLCQSMERLLGK